MQIRNIADAIARWSLILLIGLLPFFVIPAPWAPVAGAKVVLSALLIAVSVLGWLVSRLAEGVVRVPRSGAILAAAALPLAYMLSAFFSHASSASYVSSIGNQDTVVAMVTLFAALTLAALLFSSRDVSQGPRPFLFSFFIGAAVVVVVQVIRFFVPSWLGLNGVLTGAASSVVGSWHDLGIFLALVVFLVSILWTSPIVRGAYTRAGLVTLGILSFLLLIIIGMQDVWYVLAGGSFLFALCQGASARLHERRSLGDSLLRAAVSLVVGLFALAAGFSTAFIGDHLPPPLQIAQTEVRPSWQGTFAIGQRVFQGTGLLFGTGPNTFNRAWGEFKPTTVNETQFWSVDFSAGVGLIPTSFITVGALAIIAWLSFLSVLAVRTAVFLRRERLSALRVFPAAFLFGGWFLAVFHIVYTPGPLLSLLFFAFVGVFVALESAEDRREERRWSLSSRSGWMAVVRIGILLAASLLVGLAAVYAARAAVSDMVLSTAALEYSATKDLSHALPIVRRALVIYPENDAAHRAAVELGIVQLQQLLASDKQAGTAQLEAALAQAIQDGLKAVSINSHDYQNWLALAGAYSQFGGVGVSGAYENALSAYQKAAAANPTNPLPLLGAAQVSTALNDATSSLQYLNDAIKLKPDLAAAYYLRSQIEGARGDFVPAVADAKAAVSLAQQDPLGWYNLGTILYASGDYQGAVQSLAQAVSLENNYANALYALALAREKVGDYAGSLSAMRRVVELNPNDQNAAAALKAIEAESQKAASSARSPARENGR